jgi:hypothetical protein
MSAYADTSALRRLLVQDETRGLLEVHVQAVAEAHGLRPADLLPAPAAEFGMVGLPVVTLLEDAQTVVPDPLPTDPTHANVVGAQDEGLPAPVGATGGRPRAAAIRGRRRMIRLTWSAVGGAARERCLPARR